VDRRTGSLQYRRLAQALGVELPEARLAALDDKRTAGTITGQDLPARLRREMSTDLHARTLQELRDGAIGDGNGDQ